MVTMGMVIVAGHLIVDPASGRDTSKGAGRSLSSHQRPMDAWTSRSADLGDPGRVNVYERWESQEAVEAFRGDGVSGDQAVVIRYASVAEYGAVEERGQLGRVQWLMC